MAGWAFRRTMALWPANMMAKKEVMNFTSWNRILKLSGPVKEQADHLFIISNLLKIFGIRIWPE